MNTREAKDFLVQQTTEQVALDHVPFSDLERRMMYFTESGDCPEDPLALNDAFEAEYNSGEYERKVSKLMHHAYQRIRKENPDATRQWEGHYWDPPQGGDHYILVLWGQERQERPSHDSLKLLLAGLLLGVIVTSVIFLANHYGIRWGKEPNTTSSRPPLLERVLFVLLILGVGRLLVKFLGTKKAN